MLSLSVNYSFTLDTPHYWEGFWGIKIDGNTFRSANPNQLQNSLTWGQLDFLIENIYKLMNGAGTNGTTDSFWNFSGSPVK